HWIIYANALTQLGLAILLFILAAATQFFVLNLIGILALALAVLLALIDWFQQWITEIAVTNRRIIYKHGFIRRDTAEMNLDKVESVIVTQSILGRLLDYGSVHVRGTGEGIEHMHKIAAPLQLRSHITTQS